MSWFRFLSRTSQTSELPDIYPFTVRAEDFLRSDISATYSKILTDTLERTFGIPEKVQPLLWDNCVQSEANNGLVSLLCEAMVKKSDLFLVYKSDVNVLRVATNPEQQQIQKDYKDKGESTAGVYVSFKNYKPTDMLRIYSALEYSILASLHKSVNLSKAVQLKMADLRASVSLADAGIATAQAQALATALAAGRDVFMDARDIITTATPDISPTEKAIAFLDGKRAFILNLPLAYISGLQTGGIGASGEADMRAIERGLKQFYFSIIKPVVEVVFSCQTKFKSQDTRMITSALETLKTFELVADNEFVSKESMRLIVARMLDIDPDEDQKRLEKEERERPEPPKQLPPKDDNAEDDE